MKQPKYKTYGQIMFITILLVILSLNVAAFGIVMPYWEGRPLTMEPGETKDVIVTLQNVGDDDMTVEVKLNSGSEIARITDKSLTYIIPKGNTDTRINMKVSIPQGEPRGSEHVVGISVKDIGIKGSGMVQLTNSISKSFNVVVNNVPTPPTPKAVEIPAPQKGSIALFAIILIAIFAVLAAIIYAYSKKNKKPARKKKSKF